MTNIQELRELLAKVEPGSFWSVTTEVAKLRPDLSLMIAATNALPSLLDELERTRNVLDQAINAGSIRLPREGETRTVCADIHRPFLTKQVPFPTDMVFADETYVTAPELAEYLRSSTQTEGV